MISPRDEGGRTSGQRRQALVNLGDFLLHDGIADTRRTPSSVIDGGRTRTLVRYDAVTGR